LPKRIIEEEEVRRESSWETATWFHFQLRRNKEKRQVLSLCLSI